MPLDNAEAILTCNPGGAMPTLATMKQRRTKASGHEPEAPKERVPTEAVRMEADLADMLVIIARHEKISVSDIVSPLLRPQIEKRYAEVIRKLHSKLETNE